MSFPHCNRRNALKLGASALLALHTPVSAETRQASFVPAGRIGFIAPEDVEAVSEAWRLLSSDHTFSVDVYEQLRLGPDGDGHIWEKDDRSRIVTASIARDGFEIREFRDQRYEDSKDYSARSVVLRDPNWMGQVEVSTQNLGSPISPPEGQIARWNATTDALFSSIVIRPQPSITDALAEVGIQLDAPHLHPRITGKNLILSLSAPRTNSEAWAANGPAIRCAGIMIGLHDLGEAEREQFALDQAEYRKTMRESGFFQAELLEGPHASGMLSKELEFMPGRFSTTLNVSGRSRALDFTAYYDAGTRGPILAALRDIVSRIEIISST